ncbi:hypothetical protein CC117_05180 [Parafrankia colletiae]|uniref:Uncharacterized protein n=1 Tax=Parafrankia colletiae TaxID=573497 RepID=A0A1S1QKG6_9ACTN|nr:hypothetical protein [Parafrankia colletiae]MCK9900078.1 hypothetical protein [Frankia sp. Cpl3]OHV33765.1 hypothetical protein CC117_05180 [Parafrankia colletiae]
MALRISVDLEGLRWADLFRFVDLARSGGIGPEDQVDVITYGSDPMSVSLSARIYPASDGFLASDQQELGPGDGLRGPAPLSLAPGSPSSAGGFGYDTSGERPSSNGSHYPAFDNGSERPPAGAGNLPAYGPPGYDSQPERGTPPPPPPPPPAGGSHYPAFDAPNERLPGQGGGQFAGFEPVFDRSQNGKETGVAGGVESPYIEEFARLQEGLMRQVRRDGEVRPDRT